MVSGPTISCFRRFALLWILSLPAPGVVAQVQDNPVQLQKNGIALIDRWLDHVRSTGDAVSTRRDLASAQTQLQASYMLFAQRGDAGGALWSAIKLGDIQRYVNQWPQAGTIFQNVAKLAEQSKRPDYQSKALSELAFSEMNMGAMDAAEEHVREAVRLGESSGNKEFYFDALDIAGEIQTKRGNLVAAGDSVDRALALKGEVTDLHRLYVAYTDRADIYYQNAKTCDFKRGYDVCYQLVQLARDDYKKAQAIAQGQGYGYFVSLQKGFLDSLDVLEATVKSGQKQTQTLAGMATFNPKEAKDVLVTDYFALGGMDPKNLALVESAVRETNELLARWRQQGADVQDYSPDDLYNEGSLAFMKNDVNAALTDELKAVQLLEQDRRKLHNEQARSALVRDRINYYYSPALILLQQKRYPEAFALFEQSRSRIMADMLASRPVSLGTPQERALYSDLQSQRATIAALQEKLFNLTAGEDREKNGQRIADLEGQITALQRKYEALEGRIGKEAPKLNELTSSKAVTLESVQRSAAEGNYDVLYFIVMDTAIIAWHIGGTDVEVKNVFLPHAMLAAKAAAMHDSLVAPRDSPRAAFDQDVSRQLYLYLFQPMAGFIKSQHLIVLPQEELASIPFQALQNPADGQYLGERFEISYAPSATVLATLRKKPNLKSERLLAVADPDIHDAGEEVRSIGALYPGHSKVVADTATTKADVGAWVGNYDLVHLSVHGKFNPTDPLLSYLQFRQEGSDDGRLTAAEMFGLPLQKNSAVVLSACETGRVQSTQAGEVVGMVRSLLYAGADELVLSGWEVNAASTKLWMKTFYTEAQTKEPAEAARLALMAVKSRPEFAHPFYWAPFLMTGK